MLNNDPGSYWESEPLKARIAGLYQSRHGVPVARIRQLFPQAKAKVIEGTGHWLHAEQPEEFYKIVMDFVK